MAPERQDATRRRALPEPSLLGPARTEAVAFKLCGEALLSSLPRACAKRTRARELRAAAAAKLPLLRPSSSASPPPAPPLNEEHARGSDSTLRLRCTKLPAEGAPREPPRVGGKAWSSQALDMASDPQRLRAVEELPFMALWNWLMMEARGSWLAAPHPPPPRPPPPPPRPPKPAPGARCWAASPRRTAGEVGPAAMAAGATCIDVQLLPPDWL
mmetsp:Transcript_145594/g.378654  ORF Transcript_145594/g.378654 Transcript_145594/m.378654 type:complete len:214 (+) Transcript_145594:1013-1654(+)